MNGFGCCGQKLLTFSLHVNWNLSPGSESFWFTRHFSEMNGLPLLTRWEQQGSGVRCYMCIHWVCACACVALMTASKATDHEVFTLCLLFNLSCHHPTNLPFNLKTSKPWESKQSWWPWGWPMKTCMSEHSHPSLCTPLFLKHLRREASRDDRSE